ncbi:hypothetical protein WUBG_06236, partial [Wuchereria bancrofti]
ISHCPSREELIKNVNDLRMELARKDAKINDLQDYIGKLLSRIMEKNPDMLEIKQSRGFSLDIKHISYHLSFFFRSLFKL